MPEEARIEIHLKQAWHGGWDVEPPRDEGGRDSHGVSTLQERMRLKRWDTGFHW
jgi:hypothetical protein